MVRENHSARISVVVILAARVFHGGTNKVGEPVSTAMASVSMSRRNGRVTVSVLAARIGGSISMSRPAVVVTQYMTSSYGLGVEEVQSILFRIWSATEPQRLGSRDVLQDHTANLKVKVKVLDFVQFGGPAAGPVVVVRSYGLGAAPSTLYFLCAVRSATGRTSTTTLERPTTSPLASKL